MEDERKLFEVFMSLHGHKAKTTNRSVAYLMNSKDCMNPDFPLVVWEETNLVSYFDPDSKSFQWLMKQFKNYDYEKQVILCLFKDKQTLVSEVLQK